MRDLKTYVDSVSKAKGNLRAAQNNYKEMLEAHAEAFKPIGGAPDVEKLREMLPLCPDTGGDSSNSIFVCVALLFYYPAALFGGKIPMDVAKAISTVLGVTYSSVYIARNKVRVWLNYYPDFFAIIYKVFDSVQGSCFHTYLSN